MVIMMVTRADMAIDIKDRATVTELEVKVANRRATTITEREDNAVAVKDATEETMRAAIEAKIVKVETDLTINAEVMATESEPTTTKKTERDARDKKEAKDAGTEAVAKARDQENSSTCVRNTTKQKLTNSQTTVNGTVMIMIFS